MSRFRFAVAEPTVGKSGNIRDTASAPRASSNPNASAVPSASVRNVCSSDESRAESSATSSSALLCSISRSCFPPRSASFSRSRRWFSSVYFPRSCSARKTRLARSALFIPRNCGSSGTLPASSSSIGSRPFGRRVTPAPPGPDRRRPSRCGSSSPPAPRRPVASAPSRGGRRGGAARARGARGQAFASVRPGTRSCSRGRHPREAEFEVAASRVGSEVSVLLLQKLDLVAQASDEGLRGILLHGGTVDDVARARGGAGC